MDIQIQDTRSESVATNGDRDMATPIISMEQLQKIMRDIANARVKYDLHAVRERLKDQYDDVLREALALLAYKGTPTEYQMFVDEPHVIRGFRVRIVEPSRQGQIISKILSVSFEGDYARGVLHGIDDCVEIQRRVQMNGVWYCLYVQPWMRKHTARIVADNDTKMTANGFEYLFKHIDSEGNGDHDLRAENDQRASAMSQSVDVVGYTTILIDVSGREDIVYEKGAPDAISMKSAKPMEQDVGQIVKEVMIGVSEATAKARLEAMKR